MGVEEMAKGGGKRGVTLCCLIEPLIDPLSLVDEQDTDMPLVDETDSLVCK